MTKKDRHRKGYYRNYNLKHPERLARIGIFVDDVAESGVEDDGFPQVTLSDDIDDDDIDMRCSDYGEAMGGW